jgi:hypothetical protein
VPDPVACSSWQVVRRVASRRDADLLAIAFGLLSTQREEWAGEIRARFERRRRSRLHAAYAGEAGPADEVQKYSLGLVIEGVA